MFFRCVRSRKADRGMSKQGILKQAGRFTILLVTGGLLYATIAAAQTSPSPSPLKEAMGDLRVEVDMPGVKVYIDGRLQGLAHPGRPLVRQFLPTGSITVSVEAKGLARQSRAVHIRPGETAEIAFRLLAQTPEIQDILKTADRLFNAGNYLSEGGENAFGRYRAVLDKDPENPEARARVLEIMAAFRARGDKHFDNRRFAEAGKAYRRFVRVATYASQNFGEPEIDKGLRDIQDRLKTLALLETPVPKLLEAGNRYFQRQHFLTPRDGNAFDAFTAVLAVEPDNTVARQKLSQMVDIYRDLVSELEKKSYEKARRYCDNYAALLRYMIRNLGETGLASELERVRQKRSELESLTQTADQLAKEGDAYFIAERYTTPSHKNAFTLYTAALKKNPTHRTARRRMREILDTYRDWGDRAYEEKDFRSARKFYESYLMVAEGFLETVADANVRAAARRIETRTGRIDRLFSLIETADEHFRNRHLIEPPEENALAYYRKVLQYEPDNRHARARIGRIQADIGERSEKAMASGDFMTARVLIQKQLEIIDAFGDAFEDAFEDNLGVNPGEASEEKAARGKDADLEATVSPETVAARNAAEKRLRRVEDMIRLDELWRDRRELAAYLDEYRRLRKDEEANVNVAGRVVPVLEQIVSLLRSIVAHYRSLNDPLPDVAKMAVQAERTLAELEAEIRVRRSKAY